MSEHLPTPSKAARNERRKLRATAINAIALGIFAIGVIQSIFQGAPSIALLLRVIVSSAAAYVLHEVALRWIEGLED